MKQNQTLNKRLCFRMSCAFLLLSMSVQVSARNFTVDEQAQAVTSQNKKISGTVSDQNGQPITGATVLIKGTTKGTNTDPNGGFSMSGVSSNSVLIFSFMGMESKEMKVGEQSIINVSLSESSVQLDEIIAVGYGTQRKRDVTGATSTVKAEELVKRPITRIEQALQGTTPGVAVVSNSGMPGVGLSVKIRGANSITGGNEPLYVVDGFIGGSLEALNPNDIQSMEILKDASACAIYGSRGSNGVVLITTKMGKEGATKVNAGAWFSKSSIAKHLDLMDAYDFAKVVNTTNISSGGLAAFTDAELNAFKNQSTDWHKELEQSPIVKNYQVDVSGGSSNVKFLVSFNYLDQPGLIINQWYKKATFRTNLDFKLSKRIDVKMNLSAQMPKARNNSYQGDLTDPFSQANIWDPTSPVKDPTTGAYVRNSTYGSAGFNPVAQAANQSIDNGSNNVNGNGVLVYRITDNLSFTTNNTYNMGNGYNQEFWGLDTDQGATAGRAVVTANKSWNFQNSNFLTYKADFNDHSFNITALYEQQKYENTFIRAQSYDLSTSALGYYNMGLGAAQTTTSGYTADAMNSYMGRVNYSYLDRYILTASYRRDGSSHLIDKYDDFVSFAVAWNAKEESFLKDVDFLYGLKFHTSYGETGNQAVGAYSSIPRVETGNAYFYDGKTASVTTPLGSPVSKSLSWEHTKQFDFGVDASFFLGRLSLTADIYNKNINDLLYMKQAPFYLGGGNYMANMGSLNNKGLEITLSGIPVSTKDFKWNSFLTASFNRNKITDLNGQDKISISNIGSAQTDASYLKVDRPLGEFYGYEFLGTWKTSEAAKAAEYGMKPGDAKYTDVDENGTYNSLDYKVIGNGSPKVNLGFTNDMTYKDFTLSFMFQGQFGNQIYSQTMAYIWGGQGQAKTPTTSDALNMWTAAKETNSPAFSKTSKNFINSSRYVYDGSFVKLKNLSLTYHVPANLLSNAKISSLEFYVSGQNILTFTSFPGYDPEVNNAQDARCQGLEMGVIPNPRTFTLGFRLGI